MADDDPKQRGGPRVRLHARGRRPRRPTRCRPKDAARRGRTPRTRRGARGRRPRSPRRPARPRRSSTSPTPADAPDEYQLAHRASTATTGVPDAIEFIDVHKAFGRNKILNGLNLGLPEDKISMILGPSGTGKSVCIKHMVGLLYPDDGDVARARRVGAEHDRRRALRDAQEVRRAVPGRRALRLDEPLRQRGVPAAPAHRQGRGRDRRDRQPATQGGRPRGSRRQDAQRALGRHAQARRLRPRARARPGHRPLRRARLGPRPGAHRAALRADPGDPRGERRRLHRHHATTS